MNKSKSKNKGLEEPPMPFDEALKRVWSAPPAPKKKPAKKKPAKKKSGSAAV